MEKRGCPAGKQKNLLKWRESRRGKTSAAVGWADQIKTGASESKKEPRQKAAIRPRET